MILREPTTVIVPLHRELARGTVASILRQSGFSADDFREML
jgi:predicted RNA binding protein YcfA (HicA-like mRNA interferase family)